MFPTRATTYIEQKGIDIQMCMSSRPGMPIRMKTLGLVKAVELKSGIMILTKRRHRFPSFVPGVIKGTYTLVNIQYRITQGKNTTT